MESEEDKNKTRTEHMDDWIARKHEEKEEGG